MIITVTPSPSIDWTLELHDFRFGAVHRAQHEIREPSGKGVNVSIALHRAGIRTHAVIPGSGEGGEYLDGALAELGVEHSMVPAGPVRTNVTLLVDGRPDTKINTTNPPLSNEVVAALLGRVDECARGASTLVTAGSLPPGTPADVHRRLVARAHDRGLRAVADTSGEALREAVLARPDVIKPNAHELAELVGRPLGTMGAVIDAAHEVRGAGVGALLVSLGADGALLVDGGETLWGGARPRRVRNAVGAGDALLAGFVADATDRAEALRTAVRWAASAVEHATTLFDVAAPGELETWVTPRIDPDRRLTDSEE